MTDAKITRNTKLHIQAKLPIGEGVLSPFDTHTFFMFSFDIEYGLFMADALEEIAQKIREEVHK